jgi:HSP20 family molecular chaperone IbpA
VIELPPGYDLSQAKAAYQNGFLRIDVPQSRATAKKRVSILSGQEK